MKLAHFESLKPICPACKTLNTSSELRLTVFRSDALSVESGALTCNDPRCRKIFPIIFGVPILVPDPSGWLTANFHLLLQRDVGDPDLEALIGQMVSPDTALTISRQQQFSYCFDHYKQEILSDNANGDVNTNSSTIRTCLDQALRDLPTNRLPIIDLGCAVGGTTFHIASQRKTLTLGVDLNWPFLGIARNIMDFGKSPYPHRVIGNEFQTREIVAHPDSASLTDFWIADALHLPFSADSFGCAVAFNLIDCVPSPIRLVQSITDILHTESGACITTPYDWASHATPPSDWISDHPGFNALVQRLNSDPSGNGGKFLSEITPPTNFEWRLPIHSRAEMVYQSEMNLLRVTSDHSHVDQATRQSK